MKKIVLLFIVIGILTGMVTACGSAADGDQKTRETVLKLTLTKFLFLMVLRVILVTLLTFSL